MDTLFHVGIDVHLSGIHAVVLAGQQVEPDSEQRLPYDFTKIRKPFRRLLARGPVVAAYEAGCMGFELARFLEDMQVPCIVAAPGKLPRKPSDKIKTDRRDAMMLARLLRRGELEAVRIPSREEEAVRDYLRARGDLRGDILATKHRLSKFLPRHGHLYSGRNWTIAHHKWLRQLELGSAMLKQTFEGYLACLLEQLERLRSMDAEIQQLATSPRYASAVGKLRCLRGINYLTALSLVCEVGDFKRFATAAHFMAFLGLVPREYSSGTKRLQGGITKSGNTHLRRLLIEAAWHYRYNCAPSKHLRERREGQSPQVLAYVSRAITRLHHKYVKLVLIKGRKPQVAVVAIAREFAGFVWGLMVGNVD
ncbi:MAG: IS110 family transposase [Spirochaetia bacterium]|jgi:transposase